MYTAWCEYSATGEGMTVMIAIANSESAARHLFKSTFNDYYHVGMVVVKGIPPELEAFIPARVKDLNSKPLECYFNWTSTFHINYS